MADATQYVMHGMQNMSENMFNRVSS